MIRICIDATAIPLIKVGAGNYTFNLVRALAETDTENRYLIFARRGIIRQWNITQPNITFIAVDFPFRLMRILWEQTILPWTLARHEIDVLHSPHYTMPFFTRCRRVVTFHDLSFILFPSIYEKSKRWFFTFFLHMATRHADAIIAVSRSTGADTVRLLKCTPDKIHVIPEAVTPLYSSQSNPSDRNTCLRYNVTPHEFILNVGVLQPRKNITGLIDAYSVLHEHGFTKPLLIVGRKGWHYQEIFSKVEALGLVGHIKFVGHVPEEDLPALYRGACFLVYPSLYEGFGLPLLESIACGTPVITSDISSMPEVAGKAGILVPPGNVAALADAMERLLTDAPLKKRLTVECAPQAEGFSWHKTALATRILFKKIGAVGGRT